ncbi:endonuclease MutS2 [bacterium]|nr:endonuclease MutS2 [bacterium]
MFYPKNISEKLGFDQIIQLCEEACETEKGKNLLNRLRCSTDVDQVELWLKQTNEAISLLSESGSNFILHIDFDLQREAASAKGFFYETEQLVNFLDCLRGISSVQEFFKEKEELFPELYKLLFFEDLNLDLIPSLESILDKEGEIKPNASKALEKLSSKIQSKEKSILNNSRKLFDQAKKGKILAETDLSIKGGRLVLPVLSEHKNKVKGLLHDQSNTGKISYIEPLELVELNNELSELQLQKRQEIIRILKAISAKIVPELPFIRNAIQKLAVFDFIRAKARLALEFEWCIPAYNQNVHELWQARHPLLEIRFKQEKKNVVPMDLKFNEEQHIVVISGPNAGGKSVSLKTAGLLQFMLQSGFAVPVNPESKMMHFHRIFVDIGDDQSIDSDLSTYSSHLKAAKHMVNFATKDTLVLMDEIGTGTDPMFGGPMAEAVLESLHDKGAYGIITTHFSNIKNKTNELEHAVNAAMLFDTEHLKPQYKLLVGQAGSSFAYEVAANIGLNKKLIKRARALTDTKQYDLDKLLAEVQQEKEELDIAQRELAEQKEKAEFYKTEYQQLKEDLEKTKAQWIKKAKQEAEHIISSANQKVEETIRKIKENKADKEVTKKLREDLDSKKKTLKVEQKAPANKFEPGDRVRIKDTDSTGEIVAVRKNQAELIIGSIKTRINMSKLEAIGAEQKKKVTRYISNKQFVDRQKDFSSELDIRGERTEDAIRRVEEWIDSAIILGFDRLRLVHGKGNGILKQQIRTFLKPNPAVKKISYERVDLGGEGVSIIELK